MSVEQGQRRWRNRPEGSNWGDFGDDDQIGCLNYITPASVMAGAKEIKDGLSFCLSLPLDLPGGDRGGRFAPKLFATEGEHGPNMNRVMEEFCCITDVLCDDAVTMVLQYSTQWDGLCHVGHTFDADGDGTPERVYYNGWRADADVFDHNNGGAKKLGIQTYAEKGIQTRGVMLDFHRHFGPLRKAVNYDDLMQVFEADGIEVQRGDIICIHSGFGQALMDMAGAPDSKVLRTLGAELDGSDPRLLDWVSRSGISAIASDTPAVETFRRPKADNHKPAPLLPLHELCLFKLGIPLGEYWYMTELASALAARKRWAFFLTAPPLRLPGAVGSPVTAIGTI